MQSLFVHQEKLLLGGQISGDREEFDKQTEDHSFIGLPGMHGRLYQELTNLCRFRWNNLISFCLLGIS